MLHLANGQNFASKVVLRTAKDLLSQHFCPGFGSKALVIDVPAGELIAGNRTATEFEWICPRTQTSALQPLPQKCPTMSNMYTFSTHTWTLSKRNKHATNMQSLTVNLFITSSAFPLFFIQVFFPKKNMFPLQTTERVTTMTRRISSNTAVTCCNTLQANVLDSSRIIGQKTVACNGNAEGISQNFRLLLVPVRELPLLSRVCLDDRRGQRVPILQSIQYDAVGGSNTFGRFFSIIFNLFPMKCG